MHDGPQAQGDTRQGHGPAAAVAVLCVGVWIVGMRMLVLKHQGVDPAVFEADTYAQGVRFAVARGELWPWTLSGRFWPFLLMFPGIYLHVPAMALLPGGLPPLLWQGLCIGATAPLLALLARGRGASPLAAAGLALAWLLHPVAGVAMAWGWSPYVTAAPLLVGGLLALQRDRPRLAGLLLVLAALMKVNTALMVGGIGLWWALFAVPGAVDARRRGLTILGSAAVWTVVTGGLFAWLTWCVGTFEADVNLDDRGLDRASGLLTLGLALAPVLVVVGRRGLALVALSVGVELAYTLLVNPANSGLVPAAALLLAAVAVDLDPSRTWRLPLTLVLAGLGHQLFQPPRISPLPLQPAGLLYQPDPRGEALRAWVDALPPDAPLLTFDPANGAVGRHPGPVLAPHEWDHRTRVAVLLPASELRDLGDCTEPLVPATERGEAIWAGWCGDDPADPAAWDRTPHMECLDGLAVDRP